VLNRRKQLVLLLTKEITYDHNQQGKLNNHKSNDKDKGGAMEV